MGIRLEDSSLSEYDRATYFKVPTWSDQRRRERVGQQARKYRPNQTITTYLK